MVSIRTSGTRYMAPEAAIAELLRESGSWFDPAVVRAFEQAWETSRGGEAADAFAVAADEQA
jgi:response regulator RpfG family c-di-GMP phosphodiesterase